MDLGWRYSTRIYRVGNTADQYQDRSVWHHRKPLAAAAGGGSASLAASRKSLKLAARKKALACPWGPNELFAKRDEPSEEALRDPSPSSVRDSRALVGRRTLESPSAGESSADQPGDDQ